MVVYNVTVSIDEQVAGDWLLWMRETHIPDIMKTRCFIESRLCRVHGEEEGGVTYAITYVSKSEEDLNIYQEKHAPKLQAEHTEKFKGKFAAFRTLLSVVDEFKNE